MRMIATALLAAAALATALAAQLAAQQNLIVSTSKTFYDQAKDVVLRSAEKVPEELWSFKPTPDVRSFGQLVAHEADGQYEICGGASSAKPINKDIENKVKGKGATIAALKEAFAYCDAIYAKMTDAEAAQATNFFGQKVSKIGVMEFNTQHTNLHYGNMVTYMRLKGIVPASSEPRK
jgi:uncharacterized damage-inducible protein DinB